MEHLFVAPDRFRQGIGKLLLHQARKTAAARRHARVTILADPHAAGFHEKFGARQAGMHQSSIPGRKIPVYELATRT
ncbi:MAG TPA: GNAT family N-acetyltransferase [Dongiaceae bacterium]|nr:GNAT family N-acetyltransferase [Dongiaceae bacterium]